MKAFYCVILFGLAGCVAGADQSSAAEEAADDAGASMTEAERQAEIDRRSEARGEPGSPSRERVPEAASAGVTDEVPEDLIETMKDDLAVRLGSRSAHIAVIVAESLVWNDGSLGCPQPGRTYTQATVPGYRVGLELAGQRHFYHADRNGHFVPCDVQLMMPPAGKTPIE